MKYSIVIANAMQRLAVVAGENEDYEERITLLYSSIANCIRKMRGKITKNDSIHNSISFSFNGTLQESLNAFVAAFEGGRKHPASKSINEDDSMYFDNRKLEVEGYIKEMNKNKFLLEYHDYKK